MAKTQHKKTQPPLDVLVLGDHPAAYLAAALLRQKSKLRVLQCRIPGDNPPDRLALLNPRFFSLHPLLAGLKRKLDLWPIYGVGFLTSDLTVKTEHSARAPVVWAAPCKQIASALEHVARQQGVECASPSRVQIHRIDESGLEVTLGKKMVRPKVLVLAGTLSPENQRLLGLSATWEPEVVQRYTFIKLRGAKWAQGTARRILPMSLDLGRHLFWAWLIPHQQQAQLAVIQPLESVAEFPPAKLLQQWFEILQLHGLIAPSIRDWPVDQAQSLDWPLAGALSQEGLANRTLLIGPAGGFYSACGEDIYPNCWSAIFAAQVIKAAIPERYLQDALHPYRQCWRTTLGDYLRGPQQNLRFLLPLIYRNPVMTQRMAEAILQGQGMVR